MGKLELKENEQSKPEKYILNLVDIEIKQKINSQKLVQENEAQQKYKIRIDQEEVFKLNESQKRHLMQF